VAAAVDVAPALHSRKKFAASEALEGYQGLLARKDHAEGWNWDHVDRAGEWIAGLYQPWGKLEKGAEWRARVEAWRAAKP